MVAFGEAVALGQGIKRRLQSLLVSPRLPVESGSRNSYGEGMLHRLGFLRGYLAKPGGGSPLDRGGVPAPPQPFHLRVSLLPAGGDGLGHLGIWGSQRGVTGFGHGWKRLTQAQSTQPINKIYWRIGVSCVDNKIANSSLLYSTELATLP